MGAHILQVGRGEGRGETTVGQAGALCGLWGLGACAWPAACQCSILLLPRTHTVPLRLLLLLPRSLFPAAARRTSGLCAARSAPALS
jgi:hypothetical protein